MRDWTHDIRQRLAGLRIEPTREAEIVDELAQHLQDRYEELRAAGATEADASREALAELESSDLLRERLATVEQRVDLEPPTLGGRGARATGAVWQDLRYAARTLRKNAGFSVVVILTLALGIGATTAIFSVVNAAMLRPLPFADADRLVRIWESDVKRGRPTFSVSEPNFLDFRAQNHTFERLAAQTGLNLNLATAEGVESVPASGVSIDFLPALGAAPMLGRNFLPEEDRPGGNTRVAIVNYGFWQQHFGGDPQIVGRTMTANDSTYTIVGVLPQSFRWGADANQVFVPLAANPAGERGDHRLRMIGKLKPEVTLDQASADLKTIAAGLSQQYPESNDGWSVLLRSFYDWLVPDDTRQSLLVFLFAVGFVLLIACSNVANLMLARAASRRKELSIRVALGAGRSRVFSQLLVEALLLAVVAGAVGCFIAYGTTSVLRSMNPGNLPRVDELTVDARVLGFALLVSILSGLLFGLVPAFQAARPNLNEALKEAGRSGGGGAGRERLRGVLVVAEVALSVALLVGAGLLIRSSWTLQRVDPGFDTSNLLTVEVSVRGPKYPNSRESWAFYRQLLPKLQALPGVRAAGASSIVPLGGGNTSIEVFIDGRTADTSGILPSADWRIVSPGFFHALDVSLRGRDFDDRDTADSPLVAIISEDMGRRYWPGVDPVGRQFRWHSATGDRFTIVGVAGDIRHLALDTDPAPVIYLPISIGVWNPMFLTLRTSTEPTAQVAAVRNAIRSLDPKIPVSNARTAEEMIARSLGPRRFTMLLLGTFAAIALVLACVGLFGVMSYLVSQRTHDIGVRLALGALPADVFRLVVGRGLVLALAGSALGLAGAFWLSRSLESLLFRVRPTDPLTFAAVPFVLLVVALAACYVPARRATRVDPVIALRYE